MARAKLVTIVAEAVLAERLTQLVGEAGASGYTLSPARGAGSRGLRSTTVLDGDNVRLEVLLAERAASRLLDLLARDFFSHYALVAWTADVDVLRGEKFGVAPANPGIESADGAD